MYILDVGIVYESLRTCHGVYKHTLTAYVAYIKKITDPAFDIHEPGSARIDKGQCVFDFKAPFFVNKDEFCSVRIDFEREVYFVFRDVGG